MSERLSIQEYRDLVAQQTPQPGAAAQARKRKPPKKAAPRIKSAPQRETTLSRLMRLMQPRKLSNRLHIKPEEQLAIAFANRMRELTLNGSLHCVWTHPANEVAGQQSNLAQIRYAIAKAMGLIDGTADYLFLWGNGSGALEAKFGKNGQQPNQVDFQAWCELNGVPYRTFTTVEEGIAALTEWGVLTPATNV